MTKEQKLGCGILAACFAAVGLLVVAFIAFEVILVRSQRGGPDFPEVSYRVTGDACAANVTYSVPNGSQQERVRMGWKKTFQVNHGEHLYLSAQNDCKWGSVTVEILAGGEVIKTATSNGAFVVASTSGNAP